MQYTIPDYYKEFTCIADKCEDTCCAGWKIVIDKKSLNKYKHVKGKFWFTMLKSVDWIRGIFRQDKEKRCAFLNDCNLCEIYANLGEKSLCKTCRLYPRHVEEFEDVLWSKTMAPGWILPSSFSKASSWDGWLS